MQTRNPTTNEAITAITSRVSDLSIRTHMLEEVFQAQAAKLEQLAQTQETKFEQLMRMMEKMNGSILDLHQRPNPRPDKQPILSNPPPFSQGFGVMVESFGSASTEIELASIDVTDKSDSAIATGVFEDGDLCLDVSTIDSTQAEVTSDIFSTDFSSVFVSSDAMIGVESFGTKFCVSNTISDLCLLRVCGNASVNFPLFCGAHRALSDDWYPIRLFHKAFVCLNPPWKPPDSRTHFEFLKLMSLPTPTNYDIEIVINKEDLCIVLKETETKKGVTIALESMLKIDILDDYVAGLEKGVYGVEVTRGSLKTIDREFLEDKLKLYFKPHPISEANDENMKIVVGNKLGGTVLDEWENIPLEIYAPWLGHCQFMEPAYKKLVSALVFVDFCHLTGKSLLILEEISYAKIISVYDSSNFGNSIKITLKSRRKSIFRQILKTALQEEVVSIETQVRATDLWTFYFNICQDEWGICLRYVKMDIISEVITEFLLNFLGLLSSQFGCSDVVYECILWGFCLSDYIGSFCGGLIMNDALVHLSVDLALRKGKFEMLHNGIKNCLLAGALKFKWTKVEAKFAPTAATIFFEKELFQACEGGQIIIDYINETCDSNLGKYTALAINEAFSFEVRVKLRREDLLNPLDTAPSTICVIGLGSDEVQLLGDLANEDVDEANRVQIANYLCISYHAISEGMIGIEAFEAKEKLYFDIMGKAQRVDSYSYQLITNNLSTSGKKIAASTHKGGWELQGIDVSKAFGEVFRVVGENFLNNCCSNLWLKNYGMRRCLSTFGELILRVKELHSDFPRFSYNKATFVWEKIVLIFDPGGMTFDVHILMIKWSIFEVTTAAELEIYFGAILIVAHSKSRNSKARVHLNIPNILSIVADGDMTKSTQHSLSFWFSLPRPPEIASCWLPLSYWFSSPRPPEPTDLEDKVNFKGRGMLHNGIIRNIGGAFVS